MRNHYDLYLRHLRAKALYEKLGFQERDVVFEEGCYEVNMMLQLR